MSAIATDRVRSAPLDVDPVNKKYTGVWNRPAPSRPLGNTVASSAECETNKLSAALRVPYLLQGGTMLLLRAYAIAWPRCSCRCVTVRTIARDRDQS